MNSTQKIHWVVMAPSQSTRRHLHERNFRSSNMKKLALLSALVFFCSVAQAQDPPAPTSSQAPATQDARIKTLEDQMRMLADEVALLRAELKELHATKSAQPASAHPVLFASN